MRKNRLKFVAATLAFVIGVGIVWASGIVQFLLAPSADISAPVSEISATQQFAREKSGKVLIRFKEFEYRKSWVAVFEIFNDSEHPVLYVGSKDKYESDYCTLAVRHKEKFENLSLEIRSRCYYPPVMGLQTLESGESRIFSVEDYEVRDALYLKDKSLETRAQIGFEFFVSEEKRREILWSEEITFPYDEHR